jgi:hypothetical protein
MAQPCVIAKSGDRTLSCCRRLANRHGLITGATGTGKTVTLQTDGRALLRDRRAGASWPTSRATSPASAQPGGGNPPS